MMELVPAAIHSIELIATPENAILVQATSDGNSIWFEEKK